MTYNEFQREIQKHVDDPKIAYMFTLIYDALVHTQNRQDEVGKVMIDFANILAKFVKLDHAMSERIRKIERGGLPDGVEARSVANEPDTEH